MAGEDTRLSSSFLTSAAFLAIVTSVLFFYHLDEEDVSSNPTARILLTVEEMNQKHTWLLPKLGSEIRWETPPLYIWAVKLTSVVSGGELKSRIARVPGALAMLMLVMLGAWWSYRTLERYPRDDNPDAPVETYALITGLLIASSPEIFNLAREGIPDSVFAFLCFAALFCLGESFEARRSFYASRSWRQWVIGAYFLIGLAILTKGPIAFLFVLIPYVATCFAYKLRKPDWIHVPGALLALAVGGWWYIGVMIANPEAAKAILAGLSPDYLTPSFLGQNQFMFYFNLMIGMFAPWNILALVSAYQDLRAKGRIPTLLTWSLSLVAGFIWLTLIPVKRDENFLPFAPFILLLAGDALARWKFEYNAGRIFRGLLRVLRWGGIALVLGISLFISSELGIVLSIALVIMSLWILFHRMRTSYIYAKWERTIQCAAILIAVFISAEAVVIRDYVPRKKFLSQNIGFTQRIKDHLPKDADLFSLSKDGAPLHSYLLDRPLPQVRDSNELATATGTDTYLLSDEELKRLMKEPTLAPVIYKLAGATLRPRSALFKYVGSPPEGQEATYAWRYATVPPLRIAVLGDPGEGGREEEKDIVKRVDKLHAQHPFHEIFLLGNALRGDSMLSRIDFNQNFERAYTRLLHEGLTFHALLGDRDQDIAWAVTRYPLFQMGKERYYSREFYGGLVRYYALNAKELDDPQNAEWKWLEDDLAANDAPWKIVAIHRPLLSLALEENTTDKAIAAKLLPILDKHKVQLVLWSDEPWYQRVEDPAHFPVFVGAGFSGHVKDTTFASDPRLKKSYTASTGVVTLEITPAEMHVMAVSEHGRVIDDVFVAPTGGSYRREKVDKMANGKEGAGSDLPPQP